MASTTRGTVVNNYNRKTQVNGISADMKKKIHYEEANGEVLLDSVETQKAYEDSGRDYGIMVHNINTWLGELGEGRLYAALGCNKQKKLVVYLVLPK